MSHTTLTITIQGDGKIHASRDDGADAYGEVNLDSLRLATITIFEDWLRRGKITQTRELRVLGHHLFEALFDKDVQTFFETTRKEAGGERMRVQLRFQKEAAELSTLPWEYLYFPDTETAEGYFLSTNVDLVLSRYVYRTKGQEPTFSANDPLKILIVVSSPPPLQINAQPIIDEIQKLGDYMRNYQIEIEHLDKPTVLNFYDKLKAFNPHIVHFIGHGRYNQAARTGQIALFDPAGNGEAWQEDKNFADIFVQANPITSLIFLHLCQEVMTDLSANFAGLAPRLIRAQTKAVVAMHYPISTDAAVTFCRYFYRELLSHGRVDEAVQRARSRVKTATAIETPWVRDFGTPALFMYSSASLIPPPAPVQSNVQQIGNVGAGAETPSGQKGDEEDHKFLDRIITAGEDTIKTLQLPVEEKLACYQKIAELSTALVDQTPDKARQILLHHLVAAAAASTVQQVVLAMIEAL